jgi:hypothetical protein
MLRLFIGPDGLQFMFKPGFTAGDFGFAITAHCLKETTLPTKAHYCGHGFWVMLRRFWSGWKRTLFMVQPDTIVGWHLAGFKLYWTWRSPNKTRAGRKCLSRQLRESIPNAGLVADIAALQISWYFSGSFTVPFCPRQAGSER